MYQIIFRLLFEVENTKQLSLRKRKVRNYQLKLSMSNFLIHFSKKTQKSRYKILTLYIIINI